MQSSGEAAALPAIKKEASLLAEFVPKGWGIEVQKECDLNADGALDYVLVIQEQDPKKVVNNEGLGVTQVDSNPRMILIVLKDAATGKYRLLAKNDTIIPLHEEPLKVDPFPGEAAITITKNIIKLSLEDWSAAGSWGRTDETFTFRYKDGAVKLIGYDRTDFQRNSGASEQVSVNFLTKKIQQITKAGQDEKEESTWHANPSLAPLLFEKVGPGLDYSVK
jgi:hypothetical protein